MLGPKIPIYPLQQCRFKKDVAKEMVRRFEDMERIQHWAVYGLSPEVEVTDDGKIKNDGLREIQLHVTSTGKRKVIFYWPNGGIWVLSFDKLEKDIQEAILRLVPKPEGW